MFQVLVGKALARLHPFTGFCFVLLWDVCFHYSFSVFLIPVTISDSLLLFN